MKLELEGLSKAFGDHVVLHELSVSVPECHTLVLIGPSGGGKSTLLRLLAGLEYPTSGTVTLDGNRIDYHEDALLRHRRSVGTVFQAFNLFPHLTALQNIMLPLVKVHGLSPTEAHGVAVQHLQRFRLEAHAQKRPGQMSGGQRQRVAIVRAVAIRPKVLLFDEPTSALDPEMTAEVLDVLAELRTEGRNLVLVTHQMGFARQAADYALFLADGRIVEHGPSADLFAGAQTEACRRFLTTVLKY